MYGIMFYMKNSLFIIIIASITLPLVAYGAVSPYTDYGGRITNVKYCTCLFDPAVILTVYNKKTNRSIKVKYATYYSLLRANYNIFRPGVNVLGSGIKGSVQCLQQKTYYCDSDDTAEVVVDLVRGIGSSLR